MEKQEIIDRYLRGRMTPDERLTFELELKTDEALAKEFSETEKAVKMLKAGLAQKAASVALRKMYGERRRKRQPGRIYRIVVYQGIAACLVLLYFAFWPLDLPVIENDLMVVRQEEQVVADTSIYSDLLKGYDKMKEGNYLGAIAYLKPVSESDDLRTYYREATLWHLVVAYMESDQRKKAAETLDELDRLERYEYPVTWIERSKLRFRVWIGRI